MFPQDSRLQPRGGFTRIRRQKVYRQNILRFHQTLTLALTQPQHEVRQETSGEGRAEEALGKILADKAHIGAAAKTAYGRRALASPVTMWMYRATLNTDAVHTMPGSRELYCIYTHSNEAALRSNSESPAVSKLYGILSAVRRIKGRVVEFNG